MKWTRLTFLVLVLMVHSIQAAGEKKILLIAGKPSHGPGDHEFRAGCLLLKQCLDRVPGIQAEVHDMGWPKDESAFDGVHAVLIYADGGDGHPAIQGDRLGKLQSLADKGVGLGFAHYACQVPKGEAGDTFQRWIGGYYEHEFSVNPMWTPAFTSFPSHPVTRGVKAFAVLDEWYFNMRFTEDMKGITPILVAKASADVRGGPYVWPKGPYPHIEAAKDRDEIMMWVKENENGSRGLGFTGGHKHVNWYNPDCRKVVLNGLLWLAKADVPSEGVTCDLPLEAFHKDLDPKKNEPPHNITGNWTFTVQAGDQTGKPRFELVHAGGNVIGRYNGLFGEKDVTGQIQDKKLHLWFDAEYEGSQYEVHYRGDILSNNQLKGTASFGDTITVEWEGERD